MPGAQRAKFLANIEAESSRLQRLIDRVLALSALENRKALETPEQVPFAELAEGVCAQLQPAAETRGLKIEFAAKSRPWVTGESFLLEIALANLLQNALDFSPKGSCI